MFFNKKRKKKRIFYGILSILRKTDNTHFV